MDTTRDIHMLGIVILADQAIQIYGCVQINKIFKT
jgi:hypothetical protein